MSNLGRCAPPARSHLSADERLVAAMLWRRDRHVQRTARLYENFIRALYPQAEHLRGTTAPVMPKTAPFAGLIATPPTHVLQSARLPLPRRDRRRGRGRRVPAARTPYGVACSRQAAISAPSGRRPCSSSRANRNALAVRMDDDRRVTSRPGEVSRRLERLDRVAEVVEQLTPARPAGAIDDPAQRGPPIRGWQARAVEMFRAEILDLQSRDALGIEALELLGQQAHRLEALDRQGCARLAPVVTCCGLAASARRAADPGRAQSPVARDRRPKAPAAWLRHPADASARPAASAPQRLRHVRIRCR